MILTGAGEAPDMSHSNPPAGQLLKFSYGIEPSTIRAFMHSKCYGFTAHCIDNIPLIFILLFVKLQVARSSATYLLIKQKAKYCSKRFNMRLIAKQETLL
jgi:hypothetical protein